jgi:hypothetical protein
LYLFWELYFVVILNQEKKWHHDKKNISKITI